MTLGMVCRAGPRHPRRGRHVSRPAVTVRWRRSNVKFVDLLISATILVGLAATNPGASRYDAHLTNQFYPQIQSTIDSEMPQMEALLQQQSQTQAVYSLVISAAEAVLGLGMNGLAQSVQALQGGDVQQQADAIRTGVLAQVQKQLDEWERDSTTSTNYALFTIYRTQSGAPGPRFVDSAGRSCTQVTIGVLDHFIGWSGVDCVQPATAVPTESAGTPAPAVSNAATSPSAQTATQGIDCNGTALTDTQMYASVACTNPIVRPISVVDTECAESLPSTWAGVQGAGCAPFFYYYAHGVALTAAQCSLAGPADKCP